MRRTVGAALVAAAFVLSARPVVADPETATIDFENAPPGSISEAFSADFRHGPFAIDGTTHEGSGLAIVDLDPSSGGQYLTLDHVTGCGCAMLRIGLTGASGEPATVESLRIVGTRNSARIVFLDAGGNSRPSEIGQEVDATGETGSTTVWPEGDSGQGATEMLVFFDGCGGVDDIVLTRGSDHEPPAPPAPPEPPAPPPPPVCDLSSITLTFDGECGDMQITDQDGNVIYDLGNVSTGYECVIGDPDSTEHLPDGIHCHLTHEGNDVESWDMPLIPRPDMWGQWGHFTVTGETECAKLEDQAVKSGKKHKKHKKPHKSKKHH